MKDYPAKKVIKKVPRPIVPIEDFAPDFASTGIVEKPVVCEHGTLGGSYHCNFCRHPRVERDAATPVIELDYAPPPVSVVNALGAKLKQLRESQGLTVEQVAARLDGNLWRVNNMEHDPDPNISTLTQYATALDAEVIIDVRQTQASLKAEHARLLDRLAVVESQIMGLE